MPTSFKFRRIASDIFGHIYRPHADITTFSKTGKAIKITMIVDTGADYTILPRREAILLDIDLQKDCTVHTTYGVGGPQTVYLYKNLPIQLGNHRLKIPVGFLDTNNIPPLLGRHQFLELFQTCFDNHTTTFKKNK